MELVGEGGGWSLGESGVGTKVRLDVWLNSRGEVLSSSDSKLLIQGTQGNTERTSLNWLFGVSWMLLMLSSCIWWCSGSISRDLIGSSMWPPPALTAWTGLQNTPLTLQRASFWQERL